MAHQKSKSIATALILSIPLRLFAQMPSLSPGEQSVGGSPFSAIGNVSATGSSIEQVNLTDGGLHIGIPLVRLKGIGIDTNISFDYNTPLIRNDDLSFRVGFDRSGSLSLEDTFSYTYDGLDIDDDGWDDDGEGDCDPNENEDFCCDPDDDSDCIYDPDPPGQESVKVSRGPRSHANPTPSDDAGPGAYTLEVLFSLPFISTDGSASYLKEKYNPGATSIPFGDVLTQEFFSTDGSYLHYSPSKGVLYPDGIRTLGARDALNGFFGSSPLAGTVLQDDSGNSISCGGYTETTSTQTCVDTVGRHIVFTIAGSGLVVDIAYPGEDGNNLHVKLDYVSEPDWIYDTDPGDSAPTTPTFIPAISQITYPDGSTYKFSYNASTLNPLTSGMNAPDTNYPLITSVTTPGGGTISYRYGPDSTIKGALGEFEAFGGGEISTRTLNVDGTSTSQQTFSYNYGGPGLCINEDQGILALNPWTTVTYPDGAIETYTHPDGRIDFVDYSLVDGTGKTLVSKHKTWQTNEGAGYFSNGTLRCAPHDPRVVDETVTDDAGNQTVYTYSYDIYNNPTDVKVSTLAAPTGSAILRETTNTYQLLSNDTSNTYFQNNLLRLKTLETVTGHDGNSSIKQFVYDESSWNPSSGPGKLTSLATTLDSLGNVAQEHAAYESHGIPWKTVDADGVITSVAFDSTGLFPASVTTAVGSSVAETSLLTYDHYLAKLIQVRSPNDQAASGTGTQITYDSEQRINSIVYPDGGSKTSNIVFGSSYPEASISSTVLQDSGVAITTNQTLDGFLRNLNGVTPDGSTSEQTYDVLGHSQSQTNPHFVTPSSTDGRIWRDYDDLGRVIDEKHETLVAGSYVVDSVKHWLFNGRTTTYIDEAGNQTLSRVDALGNLVEVDEPNASGLPTGAITNYGYDALGNLNAVFQHGINGEAMVMRRFSYDMASRLTSSCNPETLPRGLSCDGNTWSETRAYYPSGDLQAMSNSNSVTTTYSYDQRHRVTAKNYSNSPTGTLNSCFSYDTALNGVGLLAVEWTQAAVCPQSGGWPTNNFQHARIVQQYDIMGRVQREMQCFLGTCVPASSFTFNYSYSLDGKVKQANDGIGAISWVNQYDGAGRLATVDASTPFSGAMYPSRLFTAGSYSAGELPNLWSLGDPTTGLAATRQYDSTVRKTKEEYDTH